MKNRSIYEITYLSNKRGYIYKDAYNVLNTKVVNKIGITINREVSILQGNITDKWEDCLFCAKNNTATSSANLENIICHCIVSTCVSEVEQLAQNEKENLWVERQQSDTNNGSSGILNIIANKFTK